MSLKDIYCKDFPRNGPNLIKKHHFARNANMWCYILKSFFAKLNFKTPCTFYLIILSFFNYCYVTECLFVCEKLCSKTIYKKAGKCFKMDMKVSKACERNSLKQFHTYLLHFFVPFWWIFIETMVFTWSFNKNLPKSFQWWSRVYDLVTFVLVHVFSVMHVY